jgi:DNA-binding NtrC family response regulator
MRGKPHVLIVEDESLIALDVEMLLRGAGLSITWCSSVDAAMEAIDTQAVDAAVLDINLGPEFSTPVADELARQRIPFILVSGHSREVLPDRHRSRPFITKPYDRMQLLHLVATALNERLTR